MIIYLDASIVLRLVLGEPKPLAKRQQYSGAVTSALTEVECLRTLDRMARTGSLSPQEAFAQRRAGYQLFVEDDEVDDSGGAFFRGAGRFPPPPAPGTPFPFPRRGGGGAPRRAGSLRRATHNKSRGAGGRGEVLR